MLTDRMQVQLIADRMAGLPLRRIVKPGEAVALAHEEGYSRRMVYDARKRLAGQVENSCAHRNPANEWVLAGEAGPRT